MDKDAMRQSSILKFLKGLRERLPHLYRASIAIGVAMEGLTGQGGGQRRASDDGGRGRKLNFKPQTQGNPHAIVDASARTLS